MKPRFTELHTNLHFVEPPYSIPDLVNLSLFAIVRDCGSRVREWLAHHYLLGVERFFIALHNCTDDTELAIRSLPFADKIYLHHVGAETPLPQYGAYCELLRLYGHTTEWAAVIDDDEFFIPEIEGETLPMILERYRSYSGLAVHWRWFGSSNHVDKPTGLVIEAYTHRAIDAYPQCRSVKTIVRPAQVKGVQSPHLFWTEHDTVTVDYQFVQPGLHWQSGHNPKYTELALHHYKVRSMADWIERRARGDCTLINPKPYDVERFKVEDRNEIEDTRALYYAPKIKQLLNL